MSEYLVFWFGAFLALLAVELVTQGLATIWFALGSLGAMLLAWLGFPLYAQIIAFLAISAVTLLFTRPFAVKYVNNKRVSTNVDALFGRDARVIEKIDSLDGTGRVSVGGQEWLAACDGDQKPDVGEIVVITGVRGTKLVVERKGE